MLDNNTDASAGRRVRLQSWHKWTLAGFALVVVVAWSMIFG